MTCFLLTTPSLNKDLETGHPSDLQNNLSIVTSRTRARFTSCELLERSTLALKDL